MQSDPIVIYLLGGIYAFTFWLIFYQIEIRFRFVARLKCRMGIHKRIHKKLGKIVKSYRCIYCNKPKDHPHLSVVQGGKKTIDNKFKF